MEARSGETVAYVGMTSLLAAEVVMDASARAPLRAVAAIRTLRDQEGIAHKIRIPARQNWAPAPGARAEIEALRALQDMLRAWDPRRCAYARARSAHGDLCALVREKVRAYAGAPAWELEVLTVGHHAFARFSSAAAADEFFDRPRSRFESEWDPELFICRHRGFIPMPGYYSGAPIQTLKPQQVSVLPPEAKPPPTPKTPTLPRREAPDFAGAWSYDLYVAETADRARPRSASARAETGPEYRDGAVLKEEELFESREGGERTEGTLRLRSETQRRPAAGLGNGSRAGTRRGSDASVSASDVSSAEVLVGGRREGPVAQWGRQLPQPFGFEEEIVPPSSISKATVRVRSEGRDKKTPEMRNAVTGGAFTRGTGDEIAKHKVTGGAFTGGTGGEPAEQKAAGGPASSDTSGVKIKSESRLQATDGETDLEPDEESDGVIRFDAYEDEFDDSVEGRIDGFGASWAVEPMEPSFDIPDGFETERDGVRTGGSWGEVDRPRSVVWNKEPGTKTQGASPGTGFPPGARQFQSTCTNGASTERSVQLAMAQSVEPTGEAAGKAAAGPPCKPGTAQKRVYAPLQFELSPELLQEGLGPSAWR